MTICRKTEDGVVVFWCPGCNGYHGAWVERPNDKTGAQWTWNGSLEKPTFRPSLLIYRSEGQPACHSFVTDGVIHYCGDSDHQYAGKSVQIPDDDCVSYDKESNTYLYDPPLVVLS